MGRSIGRREATGYGLAFSIREALREPGLQSDEATARCRVPPLLPHLIGERFGLERGFGNSHGLGATRHPRVEGQVAGLPINLYKEHPAMRGSG